MLKDCSVTQITPAVMFSTKMISNTYVGLLISTCLLCIQANKDTFSTCNRYTSFGYGYRDFFEVPKANLSANQVFYLEFYVRTSSDAHILLKSDVTGDEGFEIVIGGGSNTFSQIRLLEKDDKNTMITQKTENFLSSIVYEHFWISMDRLGVISVGKMEDDDVFINWRFDNPFPIKYFAFGSWTNMKADWRFGCKKQKDTDMAKENRDLTPLQKLKTDLFTLYDPNALPVKEYRTLEVEINFMINNVQLDVKRGELTTFGYGDLKWSDGKIKWNPENYNGIQTIYVPPFQIWTPNIRVLNPLGLDRIPLFNLAAAGVTAKYDGSIFWRPPFKAVSSCLVDLKYWPSDIHNCTIYLGFWMEPANLILTVMNEYDTMIDDMATSEWEILDVAPFNSDQSDSGILYIELRRAQGTQKLLLMVAYVAAVVMSLSSFWVSQCGSLKFPLCCGSLFILLVVLFLIGESVPAMTSTAPIVVTLYSWSSVVFVIPIILFVILKNIQTTITVPRWILKILNYGIVNVIFCLPELPQNQTVYTNLNDEENKFSKDRLDALRFLTMIERSFFFGYLIILFLLHFLI